MQLIKTTLGHIHVKSPKLLSGKLKHHSLCHFNKTVFLLIVLLHNDLSLKATKDACVKSLAEVDRVCNSDSKINSFVFAFYRKVLYFLYLYIYDIVWGLQWES